LKFVETDRRLWIRSTTTVSESQLVWVSFRACIVVRFSLPHFLHFQSRNDSLVVVW